MKKVINLSVAAMLVLSLASCKKESPLKEIPDSAIAKNQLKEINACTSPPQLLGIRTAGGSLKDEGKGVYLHPSGIVALYGSFNGTVDFNPEAGTKNLTSAANGSAFSQWFSRDTKFVNAVIEPNLLPRDKDGNTYQLIDEDGGRTPESAFECAQNSRNFGLMKKDPSGNILWKKFYYLKIPVWCNFPFPTMAVTSKGDIIISYVGSWFKFNTAGERPTMTQPKIGITSAIFWVDQQDNLYVKNAQVQSSPGATLSKYDGKTGERIWTTIDTTPFTSLGFDAAGNIYQVGVFKKHWDFDPDGGTFPLTPPAGGGMYIRKMSPAYKFIWATQLGVGTPAHVKPEPNGKYIFVAGSFTGIQTYGTVKGNVSAASKGDSDAFIIALKQCN